MEKKLEEETPITDIELRLRLDSMSLQIEHIYAKVLGIGFVLEDIMKELYIKQEQNYPMKVTRCLPGSPESPPSFEDDIHFSSQSQPETNRYLGRYNNEDDDNDSITPIYTAGEIQNGIRVFKVVGTPASGN